MTGKIISEKPVLSDTLLKSRKIASMWMSSFGINIRLTFYALFLPMIYRDKITKGYSQLSYRVKEKFSVASLGEIGIHSNRPGGRSSPDKEVFHNVVYDAVL